MPFIKIKPAIPTNIVRHPNNMRLLKAEGEEVDHNSYWERRLKDGDVVLLDDVGTRGSTSSINTGTSSTDTTSDTSTDTVKTHGRASLQDNAKSKNKTEDNT